MPTPSNDIGPIANHVDSFTVSNRIQVFVTLTGVFLGVSFLSGAVFEMLYTTEWWMPVIATVGPVFVAGVVVALLDSQDMIQDSKYILAPRTTAADVRVRVEKLPETYEVQIAIPIDDSSDTVVLYSGIGEREEVELYTVRSTTQDELPDGFHPLEKSITITTIDVANA